MITEIVTHGSPVHFDELLGLLLLRQYGEERFPGVETAEFRTIMEGETREELLDRKDVLLLGIGDGPFDEHPLPEIELKQECCATLVAKALGLDNNPRWTRILRYAVHTDKSRPNLALDLSRIVMLLQAHGKTLSQVVQYTKDAVEAAYAEQDTFFKVNLMDIERVPLRLGGAESWIAVIRKNDSALPRMARYEGAAVVVIRHADDHTQILTTSHLGLDMRDVIRILRIKELEKRGITGDNLPRWVDLERQICEAVQEWFFHLDANNILNGGRSNPDIPATKLSLEEILWAIRTSLEGGFEPQRQQTCATWQCSSSPTDHCPWYPLGLLRCRGIRGRTRRQANGRRQGERVNH